MCLPPAPHKNCTSEFYQSVLFGLRNTPFDTPAREIRFRSSGANYMVPDAAVVVLSEEGDIRVCPTIVVEVANIQAYDNVLEKVERVFVQSDGMVEVVLLLEFTVKDQLLDPACYLETWRYREVVDDAASVAETDTRMDLDGNNGGAEMMQSNDNVNQDINSATTAQGKQQTTPSQDIEAGADSTNITAPVDQQPQLS